MLSSMSPIVRHGADRDRTGVDDRLANGVDVSAGGKVHDGVGAEVNRRVKFFKLAVDVGCDGRIADVGVDLALGGDADGHRFKAFFQVRLVGGDHHSSPRDFIPHQRRFQFFAARDELHFGGDLALPSGQQLSHLCVVLYVSEFDGSASLRLADLHFKE
jgi:hypothetical protein